MQVRIAERKLVEIAMEHRLGSVGVAQAQLDDGRMDIRHGVVNREPRLRVTADQRGISILQRHGFLELT